MLALELAVGGVWLICCTIAAIFARWGAVKWAERKGYSALTMPMSYHVGFIAAYLVLVYSSGITLYYIFLS